MNREQTGSSRGWLLPALLAVVALAAAVVLWCQGQAPQALPTSSAATTPATPAVATRSAPRPTAVPPQAAALPGAGPPRRVAVASLGIDAPVVSITTQGTSLDPPDDPQVLGWWSGGAHAGAARGSALVTGHTVNVGGGAMDDLEQVREGAEIRVKTPRATIRYVVGSVQVLDKDDLARQAQRLFNQEVAGRLVLVTCEDWDGTGYRSNVVVTAVPVQ